MTESFLALNGFEIPVSIDGTSEREPRRRGTKEASFNKKPLRVTFARATSYSFSTPPLPKKQAFELRGIIEGRGQSFDFLSDLYSSKGLGPEDYSDYSLTSDGKFEGSVDITGNVDYLLPNDKYSISFWAYEDSEWQHYLITSEDNTWKNGSENSQPDFCTIDSNVVSFSDIEISELLLLPFLITSRGLDFLYNADTSFAPLPKLKGTGAIFEDTTILEGTVDTLTNISFGKRGAFYPDGKELDFSLYTV